MRLAGLAALAQEGARPCDHRAPCRQPGQCPTLSPTVRYDLNNPAKHAKLDFLNNLATGLVFIIVVVNVFITAFGVQKPVLDLAPQQ